MTCGKSSGATPAGAAQKHKAFLLHTARKSRTSLCTFTWCFFKRLNRFNISNNKNRAGVAGEGGFTFVVLYIFIYVRGVKKYQYTEILHFSQYLFDVLHHSIHF